MPSVGIYPFPLIRTLSSLLKRQLPREDMDFPQEWQPPPQLIAYPHLSLVRMKVALELECQHFISYPVHLKQGHQGAL